MVAYESGISKTVDPLGGSYYVEYLTDRMEAEIATVIGEIEDYGGVRKAVEDGYIQMRIAKRARERKEAVDRGETVVVGQNYFRRADDEGGFGEVFRLNADTARQVTEKYEKVKAARDNGAVEKTLKRLEDAAATDDENVMPYIVDACHAYATVGEMVAALKRQWGEFQEPVGL